MVFGVCVGCWCVRKPEGPYQTVNSQTRRKALAGGALSCAVAGAAIGACLGGVVGWLGVALGIAGRNARAFEEQRRGSDRSGQLARGHPEQA